MAQRPYRAGERCVNLEAVRHRKISNIMTAGTDVVRGSADTPYKEIARLPTSRRISAVPVVDEQAHVVGIVSEADLMAKGA